MPRPATPGGVLHRHIEAALGAVRDLLRFRLTPLSQLSAMLSASAQYWHLPDTINRGNTASFIVRDGTPGTRAQNLRRWPIIPSGAGGGLIA
jgi:hypothetical protein